MRSPLGRPAGLIAALLVALLAGGCVVVVDEPEDAPSKVQAEDGSSSTSIGISWDAPRVPEGLTLTGYEIERRNNNILPASIQVDAGETSYRDSGVSQLGVIYEYRVIAEFSDNSTATSAPDSGYAIISRPVSVGSSLGSYPLSYSTASQPAAAGGKEWLRFLAQEGWIYEVQVSGGTALRLLDSRDLSEMASRSPTEGDVAFLADYSGVVYLELDGGSGTVSVKHR